MWRLVRGGLLVWVMLVAPAAAQTVQVRDGATAGAAMADGSTIFYSLPYAAPPVGARRWARPADPAPWTGVRDASQPGPPCAQGDLGWNSAQAKAGREDCLTVSIRTPSLARGAELPVLVYIHGGANAAGDAGGLADDTIHRQGVVLVKVQYRLGVFGFLGLSALRAEDPNQSSGAYALLDQIAALKWVKANIGAFGGDPANITLSGNSAGGSDVLFLTLSPLAKGLFDKAILQSAAPGAPRTAVENEAIGEVLLDRLKSPRGAEGLALLRALPAEAVTAAALNLPTPKGVDPSFLWEQQIIDGYVMPDPYAMAYAKGAGHTVAVLIGSNRQELGSHRKLETASALVASAFGASAPAARSFYGYRDGKAPAADPLLGAVTTQVLTDMWFRCPVNWLTRRMATVTPKVWRYEFGFGAPGSGKPPSHTSEMDYVFRSAPPSARAREWPPVQPYWVNFIRSGNPNGPGLPNWPAVGKEAAYLSIEPTGITGQNGLRKTICDLMYQERDYPQSAVAPG